MTDVKVVQNTNTCVPILVTVLGIIIEVKLEQPVKVLSDRVVIPLPIVTEVRAVQYWNTLVPRLVTLLGIIIEVKPELANTSFPIVVMLLGMVIDVRAVQ